MYPYPVLSVSPYPNSALSAGQYAIIAVVAVLSLSAWLVLAFAAGREPRHRGTAAGDDVAAAAAACTGKRTRATGT